MSGMDFGLFIARTVRRLDMPTSGELSALSILPPIIASLWEPSRGFYLVHPVYY